MFLIQPTGSGKSFSKIFLSAPILFDIVRPKILCEVDHAIVISILVLLMLDQVPGGGVLPENLGRGVQPASQNPYPINDQNL